LERKIVLLMLSFN